MGQPKRRPGRGNTYYANVRVGSVRLRDSLETTNYQEALRRQRELVAKVEAGRIVATATVNREWLKYTVAEGLDALIEDRRKERKAPRTLEIDRERSQAIKRVIGLTQLRSVTADTIRDYQTARLEEGIAGRTINMEVTLLRLILKRAKRWARLSDEVKNLPESRDIVARVLSQEEKLCLFKSARSREEWRRAYFCGVISVNTTGRKIEVLRSRLRDVDFFTKVWTIQQSKTRAGVRRIDLNSEALHAFAELKRIVEQLGGGDPDHYFFPACENKNFDFTRPQKSVRTAWRKLTAQAGLKGFRIHDLRHQCLTEMAENDIAADVMMSLAGHVSEKMRRHYVHVRDQAKQKAVAALPGTGLFHSPSEEVSDSATKQ